MGSPIVTDYRVRGKPGMAGKTEREIRRKRAADAQIIKLLFLLS
jgi:hypothetical protein